MKKNLIITILLSTLFTRGNPFNYNYNTEISSYKEKTSFELSNEIKTFATKLNSHLNHSIFFDVDFLLNKKELKKYLLKNKFYKKDIGKTIYITTQDNNKVECTYFNRKSDKLIIIGGGFTNAKELMAPFIHIFDNYDLVIFDYRGHGIHESKFYNPFSWRINPIHRIFDINTRLTRLGAEEEKDVTAVVNYFKISKKYSNIYGLGICYSSLIFIKAQSIWQQNYNEKLFDKIIIDGCWLSLKDFINKLKQDLKLLCSPQYGGWKNSWPNKKQWFQNIIYGLAQKVFKTNFNDVSIEPYLNKIINTPILYFYGKDDLVITRSEFEKIWNNLKTEKTAIITSNPHVRNHIKEKEIYKLICDVFLEHEHNEFITLLKDKDELIKYYSKKLYII